MQTVAVNQHNQLSISFLTNSDCSAGAAIALASFHRRPTASATGFEAASMIPTASFHVDDDFNSFMASAYGDDLPPLGSVDAGTEITGSLEHVV